MERPGGNGLGSRRDDGDMAEWSGRGDRWRELRRRLPLIGMGYWTLRNGRRAGRAEGHWVQPDLHRLRETRADGVRVAL